MNNWRKCELWAEKCGLVDGIWYILEVQGIKRPFLGQWDEKNDRFVGAGLVGRELDEAIPLKSGKVLWICECPVRKQKENLESDVETPVPSYNVTQPKVDFEKRENEREDLKAKVDNCCECCQPIKDDPYKKVFDIMGYAALIRLCTDILNEANKYRPDLTIDDIINGVNDGKIKLSLSGYNILSPDSGEKPKIEFVD